MKEQRLYVYDTQRDQTRYIDYSTYCARLYVLNVKFTHYTYN